ncbi:conserved hypothetical protein [Stigmatella aurantiaca DW4/3-1]|uniref:Uncharacterized protein n=1 Tax=Stigmatella aurantiaca (strain DW4/3-1) TaxID=378806 RepID=Q09C43_STIAD|nr:conserved hypothetical protein [Stigmatella aurantiaca DW4/3-1]
MSQAIPGSPRWTSPPGASSSRNITPPRANQGSPMPSSPTSAEQPTR